MQEKKDSEVKPVSCQYFGYLVGQVREVLEASISDERQLRAVSGVMCDRLYYWWDKAVDEKGNVLIDPGDPRANRE